MNRGSRWCRMNIVVSSGKMNRFYITRISFVIKNLIFRSGKVRLFEFFRCPEDDATIALWGYLPVKGEIKVSILFSCEDVSTFVSTIKWFTVQHTIHNFPAVIFFVLKRAPAIH